jgi:hypothetical protein
MSWGQGLPWLQLHTGDKEPPLPNRLGLAVEPMTCPPDAFNTGTDLVRLEPGARHEVSWSIYAACRPAGGRMTAAGRRQAPGGRLPDCALTHMFREAIFVHIVSDNNRPQSTLG